jgi:hypothetical protein
VILSWCVPSNSYSCRGNSRSLLTNVVSGTNTDSEAPCLAWIVVVPVGVTVPLGLCNLRRRGCGELAKPRLMYPLVWIPCCDIVNTGIAKQNRLCIGDLESWVACHDT